MINSLLITLIVLSISLDANAYNLIYHKKVSESVENNKHMGISMTIPKGEYNLSVALDMNIFEREYTYQKNKLNLVGSVIFNSSHADQCNNDVINSECQAVDDIQKTPEITIGKGDSLVVEALSPYKGDGVGISFSINRVNWNPSIAKDKYIFSSEPNVDSYNTVYENDQLNSLIAKDELYIIKRELGIFKGDEAWYYKRTSDSHVIQKRFEVPLSGLSHIGLNLRDALSPNLINLVLDVDGKNEIRSFSEFPEIKNHTIDLLIGDYINRSSVTLKEIVVHYPIISRYDNMSQPIKNIRIRSKSHSEEFVKINLDLSKSKYIVKTNLNSAVEMIKGKPWNIKKYVIDNIYIRNLDSYPINVKEIFIKSDSKIPFYKIPVYNNNDVKNIVYYNVRANNHGNLEYVNKLTVHKNLKGIHYRKSVKFYYRENIKSRFNFDSIRSGKYAIKTINPSIKKNGVVYFLLNDNVTYIGKDVNFSDFFSPPEKILFDSIVFEDGNVDSILMGKKTTSEKISDVLNGEMIIVDQEIAFKVKVIDEIVRELNILYQHEKLSSSANSIVIGDSIIMDLGSVLIGKKGFLLKDLTYESLFDSVNVSTIFFTEK